MEQQEPLVVLDTMVIEFINKYMPPIKIEYINNTLVALAQLQEVPGYEIDFDIPGLDDELIDLITSNDELPPVELLDKVMVKFMSFFTDCLELIGIEVIPDIALDQVESILTAYYDILVIDNAVAGDILEVLEADTTKKEILFELLTRYTDLNIVMLNEVVVRVDRSCLDDIKDIFTIYILQQNKVVHPVILKKIQNLMQTDNGFIQSKYLASVIEYGEENINELYDAIEKLDGNLSQVGYEVYAYLYLKDKVDHVIDSYKELIKIENIEWIGTDTTKNEMILFAIQELDKKVKTGR